MQRPRRRYVRCFRRGSLRCRSLLDDLHALIKFSNALA